MYWVYILQSEKDGNLYVGSTSDIDKRLVYHNRGSVRSTKSRRPLKLIYKEEVDSVSSARRREKFLKSGRGREWIKKIVLRGEVAERLKATAC
ncbi:MAG: GIY-YIG nuclease family protein [Candidatus Omnitrophota bacterium]